MQIAIKIARKFSPIGGGLNLSLFPSIESVLNLAPLSQVMEDKVHAARKRFNDLQSTQKVLILGPCSIHNLEADLLLAAKIRDLKNRFPEYHFIFRAHLEKPRSSHFWRGFLLDPDLDGTCNLKKGALQSREFLLSLLEMGLDISYEFIDPFLAPFVQDLITVGFIGARTVYSQTHRQLAASLPMPVIFKNGLCGKLDGPLDAMQICKNGVISPKLTASGPELFWAKNESTHLMLRGDYDGSNFHLTQKAAENIQQRGLSGKVFVDCAHQNSKKNIRLQKEVFERFLNHWPQKVQGLMVECQRMEGNQPFDRCPKPGLSITDPCLSIDTVEAVLESLQKEFCFS
ncbi:MAG: 3-deoxy-7-phosphoheptulonate synthase [Chlamydiae bacterium]|nr:3-deoxy-7-phosphoheptulonate synthase [Chlamydiota bacterium]